MNQFIQHHNNMRHSFWGSILGAFVVLVVVIVIGVAVGNVAIPAATILAIVLSHVGIGSSDVAENIQSIIMTIRLPRVLLVALTGAALSASGAAYQGLFRNPLADPYIVGVASGAGLGAPWCICDATWGVFWGILCSGIGLCNRCTTRSLQQQ
jgi:iron complex transport system permease protein